MRVPKVGDIYYRFDIDDETAKYEWDIYIVRTVRGGKATAIMKNVCTWGKRSKKHGDFGWLPAIDQMWRKSWYFKAEGINAWRVGEPFGIFRTKLQAINAKIKHHKYNIKRGWIENDEKAEKITKILQRLKRIV